MIVASINFKSCLLNQCINPNDHSAILVTAFNKKKKKSGYLFEVLFVLTSSFYPPM